MLRAVGIALLALAACGCSKSAESRPAPPTATATATETSKVAPGAGAPHQAGAGGAAPSTLPNAPPNPLPNPLEIGSQGAKDDLYCSGVIFDRYGPTSDALSPTEEAIRMRNESMGMIIAQHGADKLMAEGVARVTQLGEISDAYGDKTARDIRAGKPRIALETCMKRAAALPQPGQ